MNRLFSFSTLLVLLAALWLVGFMTFVDDVSRLPEPEINTGLEKTDAIVVLTGGSERVGKSVELLEAGVGKKLFISGVHKKLTLDNLIGAAPLPGDLRECCVSLGYEAGTTLGNAEETSEWMNIQSYHSLRLVTANYHMPRSLLLFHAAMPDIMIIPHPISPDSVKMHEWWQHTGTVELLATEYCKYLVAEFRIWAGRQ